jgi:hypothetical protein
VHHDPAPHPGDLLRRAAHGAGWHLAPSPAHRAPRHPADPTGTWRAPNASAQLTVGQADPDLIAHVPYAAITLTGALGTARPWSVIGQCPLAILPALLHAAPLPPDTAVPGPVSLLPDHLYWCERSTGYPRGEFYSERWISDWPGPSRRLSELEWCVPGSRRPDLTGGWTLWHYDTGGFALHADLATPRHLIAAAVTTMLQPTPRTRARTAPCPQPPAAIVRPARSPPFPTSTRGDTPMPETGPTPALPHTISQRAANAATRQRNDTGDPPTWRDARWAERAEACATTLAALLQIPRCQVTVRPDYTRAYGQWPWAHLTATDPDGTAHEFLGASNDPERLLAISTCPACLGPVPTARIRTLADLGDLLAEAAMAEESWEPAPEFRGDPGHRPDCGHAHLA